jgi:DNA-binding NtrC family response regulator
MQMKLSKEMRILVVDDEDSVRDVLSQVLEEGGFKVTEAANGSEALVQLEKTPFPLVITDIVMPEMTGIELLKNIKNRYPSTEVIIITSHASLGTAVEALRCGAYDYLFKPFKDLDLILAATERAVEKIQLKAENQKLVNKLKGQNTELERRVKKRTLELERINHQLIKEIQERIRSQDAAESANRAKDDFLANMSHELRTPLNHVIGFTDIILHKHFGDLNDVQEEYLNDVLESSKRLLTLINRLLDMPKLEAQQ